MLAEQPVGQEDAADDGQRPAEDAPRRLEDEDDEKGADNQVRRTRITGALDQIGLEHPVVGAEDECPGSQQPVTDGDARQLGGILEGRVDQEGQRQQETDVQRADDQAGERMESGDDQLVGGEGERHAGHEAQRPAAQPALYAVLGELLHPRVGRRRTIAHENPPCGRVNRNSRPAPSPT